MNLCTYRNLPVSVLLFTILVELYLAVDVSKNASYPKESRESKYEDFIFHNGKCINQRCHSHLSYRKSYHIFTAIITCSFANILNFTIGRCIIAFAIFSVCKISFLCNIFTFLCFKLPFTTAVVMICSCRCCGEVLTTTKGTQLMFIFRNLIYAN